VHGQKMVPPIPGNWSLYRSNKCLGDGSLHPVPVSCAPAGNSMNPSGGHKSVVADCIDSANVTGRVVSATVRGSDDIGKNSRSRKAGGGISM